MSQNLARQLIAEHLVEGEMRPGSEIALKIDQILLHDATGPLCALQLEAMGVDQACADTAVAYVDHLLIEGDSKNADDHLLLHSAARRFGMWFSRAGNGTSHPVHQQRFGIPGKTLLGADSHSPGAGGIGMLAIGAGGLEISLALIGQPFRLPMPAIWGIRLSGTLPDWVSAKDVILEILRRHGVDGGHGRIIEYYGPGIAQLSAMDRHVIANMGVEAGAVTTVFPSDEQTHRYLAAQGRAEDWRPLAAEDGAAYDFHDELDLSSLEPLIALPTSPGNVVPVREVEGQDIYQAYVGSSANSGYRDIAVVAAIVAGRRIASGVSLEINPASRQALKQLMQEGGLAHLIAAGARLHQTGCNGCIGMGQAPATGRRSLRTVPRNFPGRSGAKEDQVYLCSPETAAASALAGVVTDPRQLDMPYPRIEDPGGASAYDGLIDPPLPPEKRPDELVKGPCHADLPDFEPIADEMELPVLLKLGDNVSTDEIMPAGTTGMSVWSSLPGMTVLSFKPLDESYVDRARECQDRGGHAIVGGRNYGQGSSREQAALAPRSLGLRVVLAQTIARIHNENLVNYGVLPLVLCEPGDADHLERGMTLRLRGVHDWLRGSEKEGELEYGQDGQVEGRVRVRHHLSPRQVDILLAGGSIPWMRCRLREKDDRKRQTAS
jgi:aconitate hydratase